MKNARESLEALRRRIETHPSTADAEAHIAETFLAANTGEKGLENHPPEPGRLHRLPTHGKIPRQHPARAHPPRKRHLLRKRPRMGGPLRPVHAGHNASKDLTSQWPTTSPS